MNQVFEKPEQLGLNLEYWDAAKDKLDHWCQSHRIPAATMIVGRSSQMTAPLFFGKQHTANNAPPLREDSIFLIASITKQLLQWPS